MRRKTRNPDRRRGVTLLEVMVAVTLSATMMTSSFVVMRSSYAAWKAHEADFEVAVSSTAVLRHLVQHTRQAIAVSAISAPTDSSGAMTVVRPDGSTLTWDHAGDSVTLSVDGAAAQPIANHITGMTLTGLLADGVTTTTEPSEVQLVRAELTSTPPVGGARTVSCHVWVRSW